MNASTSYRPAWLATVLGLLLGSTLFGQSLLGQSSASADGSALPRHLFYLHGSIVEGTDPRPVHPTLGVYDYPALVATFEQNGFIVHSEQRPANTEVTTYSVTLAAAIQELLDSGVPPSSITVAGHSKGGVIALRASSLIDAPGIRWILLAACFSSLEEDFVVPSPALSLLDRSDTVAVSCVPWMKGDGQSEIRYDTGLGHGLFYRPGSEWVKAMVEWQPDAPFQSLPSP